MEIPQQFDKQLKPEICVNSNLNFYHVLFSSLDVDRVSFSFEM
jgi:hypothetical protein